ncbi:MAG: DegT/DnrJ/EryC1/StrS family aminotransferase [Bacteriovoracaceae bacterium]|jgi:dTDP-4-amino-4,6-dideoxygalactose transaminase|nr:DegT/DnrJ/EryC1/StrS family aminotransferase [Bacteriovoracaceae bacterium]
MEVKYVDIGSQYTEHRDEYLKTIDEVLSSGQLIMGAEVDTLERNFCELTGSKHAISVANGTDALVIIMKSLGIGPGDEVITASNSFISSASSIGLIGATPVFADIDDDLNISAEAIEKVITNKTKAIMPVHLTGKCADMTPILEIAKKHGLKVIEDAAQSIMAKSNDWLSGSMGDAASFSLHPLKNLNAFGDAGIITTSDDQLAEKMRLMRNHGQVSRDDFVFWGFNSRTDAVQAAIINKKIKYLDGVIKNRRENAQLYRNRLKDIVKCPVDGEGCFDTYHLFVIQAKKRDELKAFLDSTGVQAQIHYPTPIHLYKAASYLGYKKGDLPNTERLAGEILSLPIHQGLGPSQIEYVCEKIEQFYK